MTGVLETFILGSHQIFQSGGDPSQNKIRKWEKNLKYFMWAETFLLCQKQNGSARKDFTWENHFYTAKKLEDFIFENH